MTASKLSLRSPQLVLAAVIALTAACKASESGAIPCGDDGNCPTTYPQCVGGGAGSSAGHCTEAVVGTPGLSATTIAVTPPAITGGLHPTLSLTLPALSGTKGLARKVTLGLSVGGGQEPVNKSGGGPVTLADLGTTITVDAPASTAADDKTLTYMLTVYNTPSSAAVVTATGTLAVVPAPLLAAATFAPGPVVITGGTSPTVTITLPALASALASASVVTFAVAVGSGAAVAQTKTGGGAVGIGDLGNAVTFTAPTTTANDSLVTYTLTLANGATSPATATATGTIAVVPAPTLSAGTFNITPASITGGSTPSLGTTLPNLTSPASAGNSVTLTLSGNCGGLSVPKTNGVAGAIGISDLNTDITFDSPSSLATDDKTCTYALTVSNGATSKVSATATGTLAIKPGPSLTFSTLMPSPAVITGGSSPSISILLPSGTSASTVTFTVNDGSGAVTVNKTNTPAGPVAVSDLGTTITVAAPTTVAADSKTYAYTLTVFNNAIPPTSVAASGTLTVVPAPTLSAASFTIAPASITGGLAPSLATTLPKLTSPASAGNTVAFAISGNCGGVGVPKTNGVGGAIAMIDLNTAITFASPMTSSTDNKTCTYLLTVSNSATPAAKATAMGSLVIKPAPTLASTALSPSPAAITGGTSPSISIPLPSGTNASTVTFTLNDGTGAVAVDKTNAPAGPVAVSDLGTTITVAAPMTLATDSKTYTYTLTVFNNAVSKGSAVASGTLTVAPSPTLSAGTFTLSPASITGSFTPTLGTTLPKLTSAAAATNKASFAVSANCGGVSVPKTNGFGGAVAISDLNTPITFASPSTLSTDSKTCTYTLTVTNGATPAVSVSATGSLLVVPQPVLTGGLTVTPNVIVGGTISLGLLQFPLPTLSQGAAATVALTVTPAGGTTTNVTKSGGGAIVPVELNGSTTIAVDPPSTQTSDPTKIYTYSLTATNSNGDSSTAVTTTVTSFPPATNIASARIGGTATLLPNGKVLIVGGGTSIASGVCSGATNSSEVYDPTTGSTVSAGTMVVGRCMHTAVLANNNRVYVMGGSANVRVDVFVYNAAASPWGSWQQDTTPALAQLVTARSGHSATLLGAASVNVGQAIDNSGMIVVAGGFTGARAGIDTLELFDPSANGGNGASTPWTYNTGTTTTFSVKRAEHSAVLIGPWLFFIGGFDGTSAYSSTIDVLDTRRFVTSTLPTQISTSSPSGGIGRMGHSAIAVDASTILVAGGYDGASVLSSMQKYTVDSTTSGGTKGTVTAIAAAVSLATARVRFPLLAAGPSNKYLAFGGTNSYGTPDVATGSVEIINATSTLTASPGGTLKSLRQALTATNLNLTGASNFAFLVAGGAVATGGAEIYIGP